MTTVHAYTNDQTTLDLAKGDFRRGRAAAANIVPTTTGAAKAINLVIPELKGRLMGGAIRVPVIDGSLVDLSLLLNKEVTPDEVNAAMKEASKANSRTSLATPMTRSSRAISLGNTHGSIFDATQTMIYKDPDGTQYVKVVSWYDNEYSFTCQYVRLAARIRQSPWLQVNPPAPISMFRRAPRRRFIRPRRAIRSALVSPLWRITKAPLSFRASKAA
jgi:glyceraldehyde 3-phosphate dehydrogenase